MTTATEKKNITERGKEAAARFLQQRGYEILERDWRCFAGKVDILADRDFGETRVRFDNVALVVQGSHAVIRHHVNAFAAA